MRKFSFCVISMLGTIPAQFYDCIKVISSIHSSLEIYRSDPKAHRIEAHRIDSHSVWSKHSEYPTA